MIHQPESPPPRGKLKIFFGYAAGVGKTYAMLKAAQAARQAGLDVVAGYVEPHDRAETLALMEGLEEIPPKEIKYKDLVLKEFDLEAALQRQPKLILIDELAHTNAAGCRHLKRYQDVEEFLRRGVDVYTTINVQHLESLNDIVSTITKVVVRERIPDSIFDQADQVELVDIEPDSLIDRLNQGKVYQKQKAQNALSNFFSRGNLVALREIALRRTADQVNKAAERNKAELGQSDYYTDEHILTCLSSSPSNAKVIRTAARLVEAFRGRFTALFVETPQVEEMSADNQKRLTNNLRLAEQLGARIATVNGDNVPTLIAEYAKASGVSKIVIGRPGQKNVGVLRQKNLIDELTELAPNLDIYVIPNQMPFYAPGAKLKFKWPRLPLSPFSLVEAAKASGLLVAATLVGLWFHQLEFSDANIITVYILSVLLTALTTNGPTYSAVSSILSVLAFNYFFTLPRFTFETHDPGYLVTFLIMFLAALVTSTLTTRTKQQASQASQKAHQTEMLLENSQKLQRAKDKTSILVESTRQLTRLLNRPIIFYPVEGQTLAPPLLIEENSPAGNFEPYLGPDEQAVAQWVYKNNKRAGATTNTLPAARCLYLAVRSGEAVFAVVAVVMDQHPPLSVFDKNLLIAMLGECALALEKEHILETKNHIDLKAKQEQLRANLLRAISHDLRTPLTSITGHANLLLSDSALLTEDKKNNLYLDIYDDSVWLTSLVENILAVTRLGRGGPNLKTGPELVENVLAEALTHISRRSAQYHIKTEINDGMLVARMDPSLVIQVIVNLVENAIKHTPLGTNITISARSFDQMVEVSVADDGNGIAPEDQARLFDLFFTADISGSDSRSGLGLGLYLCKAIINAHGGEISVGSNHPKGAVFTFTLPLAEAS